MPDKILLTILDGFGYSDETLGNAVTTAKTPNIDHLLKSYPHTLIGASGRAVGLPHGQMGNSEVGHLNFGAGRVVYQEITRIDRAIETGQFRRQQTLTDFYQQLPRDKSIHFMGLMSDGGVHSLMTHLFELIRMAKQYGRDKIFVHAFMDGRDTPPHSGKKYLQELEEFLAAEKVGKTATVIGRYYAMDRDSRWERVKLAYDALTKGEGLYFSSSAEAIEDSYRREITDEFVKPSVITENGHPVGIIEPGDGVIFFNFRADRGRQMTKALTMPDFNGFQRERLNLRMATMTIYDESFQNAEVIFKPERLTNILGEVVSKAGLKQLRIAETEKYPHVTFFFNGGEEQSFDGEDRVLIPSPKVATYDLQPQMSAPQVTIKTVDAIVSGKYDMIILNFANCDMVGHTGVFDAAVQAVETVDYSVGEVYRAAMENGYTMLLTADHGNAEKMIDTDGGPFTAHTTNPVRFIYIDKDRRPRLKNNMALCNVAPAMLNVLGIPLPPEMETPICDFE